MAVGSDDDTDWDEIEDALVVLEEWANLEDRGDVLTAIKTITAAVKEQQGREEKQGSGDDDTGEDDAA
jgi:hypothetical protein